MGRRSEKKRAKVGVKAVAASETADVNGAERPEIGSTQTLWPAAAITWLRKHGAVLGICLFLLLATLAVFGRTIGYEFVAYDDNNYVYDNRHVRAGLTLEGIRWALTHVHASNWHPLTTISHELDCQLYGQWPGGHHLTNLLLHAAASVVLFLALRRLTSAVWRSAIVAAFFCLHPLHVESVAWVSERKDVLSGLFFGLTLWAYAGYARSKERGAGVACLSTPGHPVLRVGVQACCGSEEQGAGREGGRQRGTWWQYALVMGFFALGLLCKPMLVTLPFVLLLLDYWPLGRLGAGGKDAERGRRGDAESLASPRLPVSPSPHLPVSASPHLRVPPPSPLPDHGYMVPACSPLPALLEKLPLLALSAVSCAITYWVQSSYGAVTDTEPWGMRLQTALTAYAGYLIKMVWPFDLATPYPRVRTPAVATAAACGLALAAVTVAVVVLARRGHRYLAVGWFWYLGMLVPVIGLITIGDQAMADRYTYLPLVGIFIALVWGGAEAVGWDQRAVRQADHKPMVGTPYGERRPTMIENDTELMVGRRSPTRCAGAPSLVPPYGLLATAAVLLALCAVRTIDQLHYWSDSETLLRHAIAVTPENALAHTNLGAVLREKGRKGGEEAAEYREALRIRPDFYLAHNNLGLALAESGSLAEAIEHYQAGLRSKPDDPLALNNLGIALATLGRMPEAEQLFRESLRADPDYAEAEYDLSKALAERGAWEEALEHLRRAVAWEPGHSDWHSTLGSVLAARGNTEEGAGEFGTAIQLNADDVEARNGLAGILFARGDVLAAVEQWKEVLRRSPRHAGANKGIGLVLLQKGRAANAVGLLQRALVAQPGDLETRKSLAFAWLKTGRTQDAIGQFREMLRQDPNEKVALNSLAWLLATHADGTVRNGREAVKLAQKAVGQQKDEQPVLLDTLAAAYAETGQMKEAVQTAEKAQAVAVRWGNQKLAGSIAERLKLYRAGQPYREAK